MAVPREVQVAREDLKDRFLPSAPKLLEHPWDLKGLPFREDLEGHLSLSSQEGLGDQVLLLRPRVLVVLSCQVLLFRPYHPLFQLSPFLLDDL